MPPPLTCIFDKLDPHLTEITPSLEKAFRSALPELAHAEAKRLVGESKAGLIAEKRNQIENELQFNLSKRDDYPHIEDVVKSIVDKIQDTEGPGATEVTYLNLVDDIGSQVNYADRNIGDIIYGDDHVFDDLTSLTIRILNPEASWESDIPPAERHMLEAALDNLLASSTRLYLKSSEPHQPHKHITHDKYNTQHELLSTASCDR